MKNQLKPIEPPYEPSTAALLQSYPKAADGYLLKLFRLFANSHRFLAGRGVINLLDKESPLSLREREIVILRTTANLNCEYEWGVHVSHFAEAAKFSREQIAATKTKAADAECWPLREQRLLASVDDLCATACISEHNLSAFQTEWQLEQQLEIFAVCGNYHTVSFVANSSRLGLEPGAANFPT